VGGADASVAAEGMEWRLIVVVGAALRMDPCCLMLEQLCSGWLYKVACNQFEAVVWLHMFCSWTTQLAMSNFSQESTSMILM
jgi:hypothetical protein